jgi:hypothetical protein
MRSIAMCAAICGCLACQNGQASISTSTASGSGAASASSSAGGTTAGSGASSSAGGTTTDSNTSNTSSTGGSGTTSGGNLPDAGARPWPDTSATIAVFSDQFEVGSATEPQIQFAATHYAGAQKLLLHEVQHLRQYNPSFLLLHYRLGQTLGYTAPDSSCNPTQNYLEIIDGDNWVQEWPADGGVQESWFFHYQNERVYNCSFGWYLAELDDPTWRAYWPPLVVAQMQACDADGLFADSYSVPNYFGATDYTPNLPAVDSTFESSWATLEHDFTDFVRRTFAGRYLWIPNIGSYITSRDPSDYSNLDGFMIEGFAEGGGASYYAASDWELQQDRILPLVAAGKILLAQTYPSGTDVGERMFVLGTYLLVKGLHTYVNLDAYGQQIQWFPEYEIDLGAAVDPLPGQIAALLDATSNLYVRHYAKGRVLVNPGASTLSATFNTTYYQVTPQGGGTVATDGSTDGTLSTSPVTSVSLGPHSAAVLLDQAL